MSLNYPGVIVPVGKVDRSIDTDDLAIPDPQRPCMSTPSD